MKLAFGEMILRLAIVKSVIILFAAAVQFACPLSKASAAVSDNIWYSIYANGNRIGTEHSWSQPDAYNGQIATEHFSDTSTSLVAFGVSIEQKVTGRVWVDAVASTPLFETFKIDSGGASTAVTAQYFPDHIDVKLLSGVSVTHKTVTIPPGVKISGSDMVLGVSSGAPLSKGQVITEAMFDPLTLQLNTYTITVQDVGQSLDDPYLGHLKDLAVCNVTGPEGAMSVYQDTAGSPVLITMAAGLVMRRDPPAGASQLSTATSVEHGAVPYSPPGDFAVATAVAQAGVAITDPRACRYLKVELTTSGQSPRTVEVRTVEAKGSSASISDVAAAGNMAPYLADAAYLSLDDPAISKEASILRGNSTALIELVGRTRQWVHQTMRPTISLGLPRSAASILQDPRGVCRDYAILYTALARAEGVPTRICAGLVAFRDKFYYHAWAESYIGGPTGWLPVDATMDSGTVDATHIPLSRGNPAAIFDVASQIGHVQARIIDASY